MAHHTAATTHDEDSAEAQQTRLGRAREAGDRLFAMVAGDAIYDRPIPERHRLIFYLGHLEAFDWNLLRERWLDLPSFRPEWDQLFAFGIDPVDGGLPADPPEAWPDAAAVRDYGAAIRAAIDARLAAGPAEGPAATWLGAAIEHRLMHLETLAYLLHELPYERRTAVEREATDAPAAVAARPDAEMIEVPAGTATLGRAFSAPGFAWDNEYAEQAVFVPGFRAGRTKVTNGDFLEFVKAGGYRNPGWWRPEDWTWITESGRSHPHFWRRGAGGAWLRRGMFAETPLPENGPVYVSYAEALAYTRWAGLALPTEEQWHRMAYGRPDGGESTYPWGEAAPTARHGNFDGQRWDPVPVGSYPAGRSAWGIEGLLGDGWEWTASPFAPLPGFRPFDFYPGYSAHFFDGQHQVMKGGSCRTDAALLRRSFRNWFQPHYPYVFAGFRCISP